jgi:glutathione S-transferase
MAVLVGLSLHSRGRFYQPGKGIKDNGWRIGLSRPPLEIARGEALLTAAARVLDAHLEGKRWIALDRLTLADLAIASPLMHTSAAQLPVMACENLRAWFARVQALDAWKQSGSIAGALHR